MLEQFLSSPGFLYAIGSRHYYLGKWICKECNDIDATDCVMMYHMCRNAGESGEAMFYFQKIRAYSDFALEIPYQSQKIKADMEQLLSSLSPTELKQLEQQLQSFTEDLGM